MIGVSVSAEEYELIRQAAYEARKAMGRYLRDIGLAAAKKKTKR